MAINKSTQNIIAREVLILTGLIVIATLIWGGQSIWNVYYEKKLETHFENQKIEDSIAREHWKDTPVDEAQTEVGFATLPVDSVWLKYSEKIIEPEKVKRRSLYSFLALFSLAYPVRGLFLLIRWAIRTVRN